MIREQYLKMGLDEDIVRLGDEVRKSLKERFEKIDEMAEYNQLKVLKAMIRLKRFMRRSLRLKMLW